MSCKNSVTTHISNFSLKVLTCAENNLNRSDGEVHCSVTASHGLNYPLANIQVVSKLLIPICPLLLGGEQCLGEKPLVPRASCLTRFCLSRSGISRSEYPTHGKYLSFKILSSRWKMISEEFPALCLRTALSGSTIFYTCFHQSISDTLGELSASKHHSLFSSAHHDCLKASEWGPLFTSLQGPPHWTTSWCTWGQRVEQGSCKCTCVIWGDSRFLSTHNVIFIPSLFIPAVGSSKVTCLPPGKRFLLGLVNSMVALGVINTILTHAACPHLGCTLHVPRPTCKASALLPKRSSFLAHEPQQEGNERAVKWGSQRHGYSAPEVAAVALARGQDAQPANIDPSFLQSHLRTSYWFLRQ